MVLTQNNKEEVQRQIDIALHCKKCLMIILHRRVIDFFPIHDDLAFCGNLAYQDYQNSSLFGDFITTYRNLVDCQ